MGKYEVMGEIGSEIITVIFGGPVDSKALSEVKEEYNMNREYTRHRPIKDFRKDGSEAWLVIYHDKKIRL